MTPQEIIVEAKRKVCIKHNKPEYFAYQIQDEIMLEAVKLALSIDNVGGSDLFSKMGKFVDTTFPEATAVEHLRKLKQESQEAIEAPRDITEYADCSLALDGATHKAGFTYEDLQEAKKQKLEILKNRRWERQADGTYQHCR